MTKKERIEALEIASKYEILVELAWWSPFQNVMWRVLESEKQLTPEQYDYLSNNKLLKIKSNIIENEKAILEITNMGKERLLKLSKTKKNETVI